VFYISVPLPKWIQARIQSICYGIPQVEWDAEENLHLDLSVLGKINPNQTLDAVDVLKKLKFAPFSISLKGVRCSKKSNGFLAVGISISKDLIKLKNQIELILEDLPLGREKQAWIPEVMIGHYQTLNPHKMAAYLEGNTYFSTPPFLVEEIQLLQKQHTPKRTFFITIARFSIK
jgi:RNA 2',3'-cyclic 3'-phosphodiesterase